MQNFLRISIFFVCIAAGVGLAVSLATHLKPEEKVVAFLPEPEPHSPSAEPAANSEKFEPPTNAVEKSPPPPATHGGDFAPVPKREETSMGGSSVLVNTLTEPIAAVPAPYQSAIAQQVQDLQNRVQNLQDQQTQENRSAAELEVLKKVNAKQGRPGPALETPQNTLAGDNEAPVSTPEDLPTPPNASKTITDVHRAEGDNSLELNLRDSDLRQVLDMISEQTGMNILASPNVKGVVTATLKNVDARSALNAILKSTGYVSKVEGMFIYVGTPEEINTIDNSKERLTTRIYHPNYVKAHEIQILITPLLTQGVGKVSVCTPAEAGIPADSSGAGGDSFAGGEVLLVRDYQAVLWQIDQIVQDIDKRPRQVSIESMILSVTLSDQYKMGIDFQVLRQNQSLRLTLSSPQAAVASIDPTAGGLNIGLLGGSLASFVEALETIGDTNVIASPRLMCLNKQKAEILIGSKLGYISTTVTQTSSTQTVNFLEVGTQLRIRPFIYSDGTIRMEVHPELSTGSVQVQGNFTLPDKNVTEVTTNIMCQDGNTVVIGGLIREELDNSTNQVPLLGNLPWVGPLFRHTNQTTIRNEIIVLITPRITCDSDNNQEGNKVSAEYLNRQSIYADKMSPIGKRHCGEKYLRLSHAAWAANDASTAFRYANLSIHFDPMSLEAVNLRQEIINAHPEFDERLHARLRQGLSPRNHPHKNYTKEGFPWQSPAEPDVRAPGMETYDPGQPGTNRTVSPVSKTQSKSKSVLPTSYAAPDAKPTEARPSEVKQTDAKQNKVVPPAELKTTAARPLATKAIDARPTESRRAGSKPDPAQTTDPRSTPKAPTTSTGMRPNPFDMTANEPKQLELNPLARRPRFSKPPTPTAAQQTVAEDKMAPIIDADSLGGNGNTSNSANPRK